MYYMAAHSCSARALAEVHHRKRPRGQQAWHAAPTHCVGHECEPMRHRMHYMAAAAQQQRTKPLQCCLHLVINADVLDRASVGCLGCGGGHLVIVVVPVGGAVAKVVPAA